MFAAQSAALRKAAIGAPDCRVSSALPSVDARAAAFEAYEG